ncbi:hypothetical protein GFS24_28100 [Chitinophaga sp. SYP-B3965]|uniref:hypothetical protein n=1 Tax=Chitinophaga sp. SYP-B3965 TaxID=2663120 RepID=UPI001299D940|nr:hypothetical protein [Chitinophaga sp. SYP-B3965]MRG49004.1 hypothetical protein [Chitinophaga sp. SYP-B3965]
MKKHLLGIFAAASAIALSSFTAPKTEVVSFHFLPPNGYELAYENPMFWEVAASSYECNDYPNDVCILRISEDYLYTYPGTRRDQLAAYLADQGVSSTDFSNAGDAVAYFTFSMKP